MGQSSRSLTGCPPSPLNLVGLGSMHHTCSTKSATLKMCTVGDYRRISAFYLGMYPHNVSKPVLSFLRLLGTPMWLAALYSKSMDTPDKYWIPPMWFTPGIAVMQASTIFVPCYQILRTRRLKKETLDIIAEWEKTKDKSSGSIDSASSRNATVVSTTSSRRGEMYTMNALETALVKNSTPLLLFAALKDFSGENISFLNHVRDWKAAWNPAPARKPTGVRLEGEALRRHLFSLAVEIYSSFVSMRTSNFPVNLSSADQKELEAVFDSAAALIAGPGQENSATPFDIESISSVGDKSGTVVAMSSISDSNSTDAFIERSSNHLSMIKRLNFHDLEARLPADIEVPISFSSSIFDNAEKSIKYMVLTNTWPKFVQAGYANVNLERRGGGFVDKVKAKISQTVARYPEV